MKVETLELPINFEKPRYADDVDLRSIIIGGEDVENPIRYSDDVWNLNGHVTAGDTPKTREVRFAVLPPQFRSLAKDWLLIRTNPHLATEWLPATERDAFRELPSPRTWSTAAGLVTSNMKTAFWLLEQHNLRPTSESEWDEFATILLDHSATLPNGETVTVSPGYACRIGNTLKNMHDSAHIHGHADPFGTRPFGNRHVAAVFGYERVPRGEYRNRVEPHAHVAAWTGICLWMLENLAGPVLDRLEWWYSQPAGEASRETGSDDAGKHQAALDQYVADAGAIPILSPNSLRSKSNAPNKRAMELYAGLPGTLELRSVDMTGRLRQVGADPYPEALPNLPGWDGTQHPWNDVVMPGDGLETLANTLVYAAHFLISSLTGLRPQSIAALEPGCITEKEPNAQGAPSQLMMRGWLFKGRPAEEPEERTWPVNRPVADAVSVLERISRIYGIEHPKHRRTKKPCFIVKELLTLTWETSKRSPLMFNPASLDRHIGRTARVFAERGLIRPVDELVMPNARMIRATAMAGFARQRFGDALAAAMGGWTSLHVTYGYTGNVPVDVTKQLSQLPAPAEPELANEMVQQAERTELYEMALTAPESLSGAAVAKLEQKLDRYLPASAPVSRKALEKAARRSGEVTAGFMSYCMGGPGGLCTTTDEIAHRHCQLGCGEGVMSEQQRLRLEYSRRATLAALGPIGTRYSAKVNAGAPEIEQEYASMSDAELLSCWTHEWPTWLQEAVADA